MNFTNEKTMIRRELLPLLCLYCGKSGHRIMDHKTTTQRVNFVTRIPNVTSTATAPFAIEIPPATQQQGKV